MYVGVREGVREDVVFFSRAAYRGVLRFWVEFGRWIR